MIKETIRTHDFHQTRHLEHQFGRLLSWWANSQSLPTCLPRDQGAGRALPGGCVPHARLCHQASTARRAITGAIPFAAAVSQDRCPAFCGKDDTRHVSAHFRRTGLHSIPTGGDIPDATKNRNSRTSSISCARWKPACGHGSQKTIPCSGRRSECRALENDVWSHKQLLDVVSHTPSRPSFSGREAFEWHDVTRGFVPHTKIYSWWIIARAIGRLPTAAADWTISG